MNWKQHLTENLAGIMGFLVRGALMIDAILVALASIYLTFKFCFRAVQYLDRVLLANPW